MTRAWLIVFVLAGCRLTPIELVGKACPCPAPLVCDETANECVAPDAPATLQSLVFSAGTLSPPFSTATTQYALELPIDLAQVDVTPTLRGPPATLLVEGKAADSGATATIDLLGRVDPIGITITAGGGATSYSIAVVRSHYLKPATVEPDAFGSAVALGTTSFGETLVVGAPDESSTGIGGPFDTLLTNAGAAFVYARVAGSWQEIAYLKAPVPHGGALFGADVAISGDSIAVGASCEDVVDSTGVLQTCAGAVHVYTWNGTTFREEQTIAAPKPKKSFRFGFSVALQGDTLVAGATGDATTGPTGSGAAYVYGRSAGAWTSTQTLKAGTPTKNAQFGYAVALDGETIAVSARVEDVTAGSTTFTNAGAVYMFDGASGTWIQAARLFAAYPSASEQFGFAVALAGDTVAIGAPLESSAATGIDDDEQDVSQPNNGAVFVYTRGTDGSWSRQAYVKATNEWPVNGGGIQFGHSVALEGDFLLVGGWTDRSAAVGVDGPVLDQHVGAGSAYLYARTNAAWMPTHFLKASNTGENDRFGAAVALSTATAAVGASFESVASAGVDGNQSMRTIPAMSIGAVYAFPR